MYCAADQTNATKDSAGSPSPLSYHLFLQAFNIMLNNISLSLNLLRCLLERHIYWLSKVLIVLFVEDTKLLSLTARLHGSGHVSIKLAGDTQTGLEGYIRGFGVSSRKDFFLYLFVSFVLGL